MPEKEDATITASAPGPKPRIIEVQPPTSIGDKSGRKPTTMPYEKEPDELSAAELAENSRKFGLKPRQVAVRVKPGCGPVSIRIARTFNEDFDDRPVIMATPVYNTFVAGRSNTLQVIARRD